MAAPPPVIYAFEVRKAHTISDVYKAFEDRRKIPSWKPEWDTSEPFWVVNPGDIGWVRHRREEKSTTYARISLLRHTTHGLETFMLNGSAFGYVPQSCLEYGQPRSLNNLNPSGGIPSLLSVVNMDRRQNNKFLDFMSTLVKNIKNEETVLVELGFSVPDIEWISGSNEFGNLLTQGMSNAGTLVKFSDRAPTHDELWGLKHVIMRSSSPDDFFKKNPGIYALLYRTEQPDGRYSYWWYVGKSEDINFRLWQHQAIIESQNPPIVSKFHYTTAQKVFQNIHGEYCMISLAIWKPRDIKAIEDRLLRCSEQGLMCALDSMSDETPSSIGEYATYGQDYAISGFMRKLTRKVAATTGWTLTDGVKGLNFSMAMAESARMEAPWFLQFDVLGPSGELVMEQYHRRPGRIGIRDGVTCPSSYAPVSPRARSYTTKDGKVTSRTLARNPFNALIPSEWQIPRGTAIHVVVEIVPGGQIHHTAYLRFPPTCIGAFSNIGDLMRIAIRIEWQINGIWRSGYLQCSNNSLYKLGATCSQNLPEIPYLPVAVTRMQELFYSLKQVDYIPGPPNWIGPRARLPVQKVVYNHLQQSNELVRPSRIKLPTPVLQSLDQNFRAIAEYFRYDNNISIGKMPVNFNKGFTRLVGATTRTRCDTCFMTLALDGTVRISELVAT